MVIIFDVIKNNSIVIQPKLFHIILYTIHIILHQIKINLIFIHQSLKKVNVTIIHEMIGRNEYILL